MAKVGRPTKLTQEIIKDVEDTMYLGGTKLAAALHARIGVSTFMLWQKLGQEAREKLDSGGKLTKAEKLYLEFLEALERGTGDFAREALLELQTARRNGNAEITYRMIRARIPDFEPRDLQISKEGEKIMVRLVNDDTD